MDGGYDDGYRACTCFWGTRPGSLMSRLRGLVSDFSGLRVLDVGCGEGKNAAHLARLGASVEAFDVSEMAIKHARSLWPSVPRVTWQVGDVREFEIAQNVYDIIIVYGLLHCLRDGREIQSVTRRLKDATRPSGYHVLCTFNDRHQELHAHPAFTPVLLPHTYFTELYIGWDVLFASDEDLHETHPHNNVPHTHSMTRIIAQKES